MRACLTGEVVLPGEPDYAVAKQLDSGYFDHISPQGIAYCETVADVRTCLSFAQDNDIHVELRSGGHSAAGYSTTTGLVLDMSRHDQLRVGPSTVEFRPGLNGVRALARARAARPGVDHRQLPDGAAGRLPAGGWARSAEPGTRRGL
ncbi:MAG: FAD-dependent oxidoreductase [Pseudonocardiaceae bacterium]|nr:FAD-dependent oxidoreductase [Pseudonocardiaceae bacterium]